MTLVIPHYVNHAQKLIMKWLSYIYKRNSTNKYYIMVNANICQERYAITKQAVGKQEANMAANAAIILN